MQNSEIMWTCSLCGVFWVWKICANNIPPLSGQWCPNNMSPGYIIRGYLKGDPNSSIEHPMYFFGTLCRLSMCNFFIQLKNFPETNALKNICQIVQLFKFWALEKISHFRAKIYSLNSLYSSSIQKFYHLFQSRIFSLHFKELSNIFQT